MVEQIAKETLFFQKYDNALINTSRDDSIFETEFYRESVNRTISDFN